MQASILSIKSNSYYTFSVMLFMYCCSSFSITAQVTCSAQDSFGSAYPVFIDSGIAYEDPDCEHTDFGPHVTQAYDNELGKNVFVFHSHIVEDNDRCQIQDRVRMEIKGGPGTDTELQHVENDISYYRWKFKVDEDFVGSSTFNHIFQNKAKGGNDDGFPVLTLTLRSDRLELRHDGGDTGQDQGVLAQVNINQIRGQWVECYCKQVHGEAGSLEFSIRSMKTGLFLMQHSEDDIDLWRPDADYNRPKWGMYRLKNTILRDEMISFADFCISESDSTLCPSDAILIEDIVAPTIPLDLRKGRTFISSVELLWEPSSDAFGVSHYELIQDGVVIQETEETYIEVDGLQPATTYNYTVKAVDRAGNSSEESNVLTLTTFGIDDLPLPASGPIPADLSTDISTGLRMEWKEPDNADSYNIYLGTDTNPPLINTQFNNRFDTTLLANTTYYWRIGSVNTNGETSSALWSFTTAEFNADDPWLVYRADDKPQVETNFYALNEAPAQPPLDELVLDPNGSGNTFYAFRSDTEDKFRWRHDFLTGDSVITIVARLQAASNDVNGLSHFEIRANGWREKVRINNSTIKLERSDDVEVDHGLDFVDEMHIIRIVSDGKNTSVYIDESPTPLVSGTSLTSDMGTYFEWGKSGGADYGAIVDWIAIDKSGGYSPQQGTALPEDLFLSSIATLADLSINEETISGFSPQVSNYIVEVADNQVPQITWQTTSPLAVVDAILPSTAPSTSAKLEVTAQDGYTQNVYTVDLIGTSTTEESMSDAIKIYPNPVNDLLYINISDGSSRNIEILSLDGKVVAKDLTKSATTVMDIGNLIPGSYILSVSAQNKENFKYKINKN